MKEKIDNFSKNWSEQSGKYLARIYAIFIIFTLFFHIIYSAINIYYIKNDKYEMKSLNINDFTHDQLEIVDEMTAITSGDDGKLIYTGDIRNIRIKCTFSDRIGEFVSFYNKSGDNSFSVKTLEHVKIIDGYYTFEYPIGTKQVRIDLGIFPSITVDFDEIIINYQSANIVFGNTTIALFNILVLPSVIFITLDVLIEVYKKLN